MRSVHNTAVLTCLLGLALPIGCFSYEVTVDSHLSNCTGVSETTCMLLSDAPDAEQRLHYGAIVGFDYAWCSTHTLVVHDEAAPPAADGSATYPVLDEVVATQSADGETFALTLLPGWQPEVDDTIVPYHCTDDDAALCASIDETLGDSTEIEGEANDAKVEAQFACEGGKSSPRLLSFEALNEDER